jgi:spermidine/putrescine-binding protein
VLARRDLPAKPALMDMGFSVAPAVLVHFAEMNGGGLANVDPGFKMLASLKDQARFFKLFEVLDWINRGEASVAPMLNTFVKKDPNVPLAFTFADDGVLGVVNMACIPKAAKHKAEAEKFLNFYLSADVQARMAASFGETPVVKNVKVSDDVPYSLIPIERFKELKVYDPMVIGRQNAKWQERFQEEIVAR